MDEKDDPLGLDDQLCFAVYSTGLAFNRVYKPLLDELGLTYPQYLVMLALWDEDGQTVGGLGERLFLESNTLTPLLKRLEAMGHVTRARDAADERVVRLRLTPEGRALRARAAHVQRCVFGATGLTADILGRLRDDMVELRAHLRRAMGGEKG